jgi:hypothetical protein
MRLVSVLSPFDVAGRSNSRSLPHLAAPYTLLVTVRPSDLRATWLRVLFFTAVHKRTGGLPGLCLPYLACISLLSALRLFEASVTPAGHWMPLFKVQFMVVQTTNPCRR